jgi:glutathione S-transferase
MQKLLYSPASPYSAKVRMAAAHAGIQLEAIKNDDAPHELLQANPLGKIPVLITEDGLAIYDSRTITQYFNRVCGNRLFPRNPKKRTAAEMLEALADGICDSLLACRYERLSRPEEKVHEPWLEKQWSKVTQSLDHLESVPPKLTGNLHAGQIALRSCLAYMDLRFPGSWQPGRTRLKRWVKKFDEKFPELAVYLPA